MPDLGAAEVFGADRDQLSDRAALRSSFRVRSRADFHHFHRNVHRDVRQLFHDIAHDLGLALCGEQIAALD